MNVFDECGEVNELLHAGRELEARNALIRILAFHKSENRDYPPVLNRLIRNAGLYPYLKVETASWQDRMVFDAFKVDVGGREAVTLHREQANILKRLLNGESLAISAPTSFGKSFIIDSFISLNNPDNVVIIVPTLALTDETRRRLQRKFGHRYKLITTSDVSLGEKNILVFPQERAIGYAELLEQIDILIVDEFYKASPDFDEERASVLIRAILKLSEKAKQKYYLAPNISHINESVFTRGMEFVALDFNTVFLEKKELYKEIKGDEKKKGEYLLQILGAGSEKTLIYAGTYSGIEEVSELILEHTEIIGSGLLKDFADWLGRHYSKDWQLIPLVQRATGIHNGQLHRSLSQLQLSLFEDQKGLTNIISTSSIIEGVNSSAENVILWKNKNGTSKLTDFDYKNIIGRGGRMFKHFIGKIYILESPPREEDTELNLTFPDQVLNDIDEARFREDLSADQISKIISYREEMSLLFGSTVFEELQKKNLFQTSNHALLRKIAGDIRNNPSEWAGLNYLNSASPEDWTRLLYKILRLQPGAWGVEYRKFVEFVKVLSFNWINPIPRLLDGLAQSNISVEMFFKLERLATYKLAAVMNDLNVIQRSMQPTKGVDISPFVARLSHAFLPSCVYQLEEYGLPRMISKRLNKRGPFNFEDPELTVHKALELFAQLGRQKTIDLLENTHPFDRYILNYFFDGIGTERAS
ncbi:DEAD/DEAH box helicase [Herbaspirillum robiniae]|uniref:DEAD/DEAH box helicase n=1 Tax=Herbaspirillum robiniae TaxID=2014887 RepID=UPI0009A15039|nr:DEAD/DEAH box helicase [Herbaspirillum robiniae]